MRAAAKGWVAGAIGILSLCLAVAAQPPGIRSAQAPSRTPPPPRRFETSHEGIFGGQHVSYKAVVAEHFITDAAGKRLASVFTTSFLRIDVARGTSRPVLFAFNGGPGSASLWLQMGFLGPRRIDFADTVQPETVPPFPIVDNPDSPLDAADIVLMDPPGTGFSRLLPDGKPEQFYGTQQDAQAAVDIIEQWVRENDRWDSPRYLIAESYGTVRAAVVAKLLAGGPTETGNMDGLSLNGIILLGQAMDMAGTAGADERYVALLPTLAATACYHHKAGNGCTPVGQVAEAEKFGSDPYLKALYAGSNLAGSERQEIVARLASLTGLPPAFISQNDLRISATAFADELLRDQGKGIGLYDGRFTLPLEPSGHDPVADDPAMGQYTPAFVAAYNIYTRHELAVNIDEAYQAIAFRSVNLRWDYGRGPGGGPGRDYATDLAVAMRRNPQLRLMIGEGYYDLVTPLGAAGYTLSHNGFPQDRTSLHLYPSGHMPYLGREGRQMLARDVRAFLGGNRNPKGR